MMNNELLSVGLTREECESVLGAIELQIECSKDNLRDLDPGNEDDQITDLEIKTDLVNLKSAQKSLRAALESK